MSDDAMLRRDNLRRLLAARGLTPSDLARMSGNRVSYYSDLLNPNGKKHFGEKAARSIEELLGLRRGELDEAATQQRATSHSLKDSVVSIEQLALVPLLTWDIVPRLWTANVPAAKLTETFLRSPVMTGPNTFAVRVRGDSMTSAHGRSYPDGCAVFVDPDRRDPPSGARVLARLANGEPTFKVFRDEDGSRWLQPLNPQYPIVRDGFEIIGTVIGKWEDE